MLAADLSPAELESVLAGDVRPDDAPHHHLAGRVPRRAGAGAGARLGHDREENENSINCIGAPVRSASGRAVAAVSVSVPDIVLADAQLLELLPALLTVTEKISRDCGWTGGRGRAVGPASPGLVARVAGSDTLKGHSA